MATTKKPTTSKTKKEPIKKAIPKRRVLTLKVTQGNIKDVELAQKGLRDLYDLTKKYTSTTEYLTQNINFFNTVKLYYARRLGESLAPGDSLPWSYKEVRLSYSNAKQIYAYARNHTNKEKTEGYYMPVARVYDLLVYRVAHVEGLEHD